MRKSFHPQQHFWTLLVALLAACEATSPQSTPLPASTPTNPIASHTPALPTQTSPTATVASTSFPAISTPPDGLRMAYVIDGNLYFQDGSNPPRQLTQSGEDSVLFFSENGEKIFFFRGVNPPFELYAINIDGSEEQVLVTNDLLQSVDASYSESTGFQNVTLVPGTHILLFGTVEYRSNAPRWNNDLLKVDSDTAEIKRLLSPNQAGSFDVSPDGRFIAINTRGKIDILDVEGKHIHRNLVTYTPSKPVFLDPGISWMSDSKGLIVTLPVPTYYETSASGPSYTVWRYILDDGMGVKVSLDILPTEVYKATVSPDGNWILYNNADQNAFYLGDLLTGKTQIYEPNTFVFHYERGWSPDSKRFIYRGSGKDLFIGTVNSSPELVGKGEFLGWIDANRYLYYADKNVVMGDINGQKEIIVPDREFFQSPTIFTFILP